MLAAFAGWVLLVQVRKQGFQPRVFWNTLVGLDWGYLGAAVALSYATYVGRALRWRVLLKPLKPHPGVWPILSATVIGFTATVILGRAGEMVRPYLIARKEMVPFPSQIAAWVVERIYDVLVALAVFGIALSRVRASGAAVGPALSWTLEMGGIVVGLAAIVCLGVLLAMAYFTDHLQAFILRVLGFLSAHHLGRVEKVITSFLEGVQATRSQSATAKLILYTVGEWVLIAACYGCVLKAFGAVAHLGLFDVLIFMGFVAFGSIVQLPGVGGGAQMTAVLVLTQIFGISLEVATSVALLIWAITFLAIVPIGLVLAFHEGLSLSGLRTARLGEGFPERSNA